MNDRYDAYNELGGNTPSEVSPESEQALYNMGLGSKEMRARVEARNKEAARIEQDKVNKLGAALVREAGVPKNAAEDPQAERLRLIKEERNRNRKS